MKSLFTLILILSLLCPAILFGQKTITEEVVFKSGDAVLSGTLVLPENADNVPVLIFLGGVDEHGDFHDIRESFIQENFEAIFPSSGIALFYYDPRGVGNSTGRWHRATLEDFASDAKAAIQFLKQRKEIDVNRIGLAGHGEDGWVAQIVAANNPKDLKMMVSLAGPPFDANTQLINEYHNQYVCAGEDSTRAYERAVQKANSHENWVSLFPLTKRWRHMKLKQDFDPVDQIREIEIPSLFIFGAHDGSVYSSWAMNKFQEIFPDSLPPHISVETIPGANHYFKVTDRCQETTNGDVDINYSFRFKEVLRNWVFEHL